MAENPWVLKSVNLRYAQQLKTLTYQGPSETYLAQIAAAQAGWYDFEVDIPEVQRTDGSDYNGQCILRLHYTLTSTDVPDGTAVDGEVELDWDQQIVSEDVPILAGDQVQLLRAAHPEWVGNIISYVDTYNALFEQALRNETDPPVWQPQVRVPAGALPLGFTPSATLQDRANELAYTLRDNPDDTVPVTHPVISKVWILRSTADVIASAANLNRVHTYARLKRDEPTIVAFPILDHTSLNQWLWIKRAPVRQRLQGNLRQVTQDWEGVKAASTLKYGDVLT